MFIYIMYKDIYIYIMYKNIYIYIMYKNIYIYIMYKNISHDVDKSVNSLGKKNLKKKS